MNKSFQIGQTVRLPDGPNVKITKITEGTEYGDAVWYLTGTTSLGTEVTRWVVK